MPRPLEISGGNEPMSSVIRASLCAFLALCCATTSASAGDAFLCYKTRLASGASESLPASVAVADVGGAKSLDLKKGKTLCVPADVGSGIADADVSLRGYRSRLTKGLEKYDEELAVKVSNQLGDLFVDKKKQPKMLLVPTSTGPSATPPDPALHEVDHYRCHKAKVPKGGPPFPAGTQVSVSDAFTAAKTFDLKKPTNLCTPVDVDGVVIDDPAGSLLCYKARRAQGEAKHTAVVGLEISNSVGNALIDTRKEVEVCLPSRAVARCNGFNELCDRGFDAVAHPTTHNAMSNAEEGWAGPNQQFSITNQLLDGVRGLMLDTWYFDSEPVLCHGGDVFPCDVTGMKPLADGLVEITDFLDDHPDEVVSIIFESYISEADTLTAFIAADLLPYTHVQSASAPWPTLRELIEADTRLVVFTDDGGAGLSWHHYVWDHAWETHFSFLNPGEFSCDINRGSMSNQLFILNHFLTNFIGSPALANLVNHNPLFIDRAEQCESESGVLPNFVTVDFHNIGDLFDVVNTLNGVGF